jgi:hypothetical protein
MRERQWTPAPKEGVHRQRESFVAQHREELLPCPVHAPVRPRRRAGDDQVPKVWGGLAVSGPQPAEAKPAARVLRAAGTL